MGYVELVLAILGFLLTDYLFKDIKFLPRKRTLPKSVPKISVIIPARNEENNLPNLLKSLNNQSFMPFEVICVDDQSTDHTRDIIKKHKVKLISASNRPYGWMGKNWACQTGASVASGDLLLFIDADVVLEKNALLYLVNEYQQCNCTISVKPYHITKRVYEHSSLFFNLIEIVGNGSTKKRPHGMGLYGPVILIPTKIYREIGGHRSIKSSIVDDLELGARLNKLKFKFRLYMGKDSFSYRMYPGGYKELYQGWTKNISYGACKTPFSLLFLSVLFISSLISVPEHIIIYAVLHKPCWLITYLIFYMLWCNRLKNISSQIGDFSILSFIFYPIYLLQFLLLLVISFLKKILGLRIKWKGRSIRRR